MTTILNYNGHKRVLNITHIPRLNETVIFDKETYIVHDIVHNLNDNELIVYIRTKNPQTNTYA